MKSCPRCGLRYPDDTGFCFLEGETLTPLADATLGHTLGGRFRLLGALGESAWARVYRARERLVARPCTVKIFRAACPQADRPRLLEALGLAGRCSLPGVFEPIAGGFAEDGAPFVVRRELAARSLREILGQLQRPLAPEQALGMAAALLRVLGALHDFGVVHGGLRPSNVLVDAAGRVGVCDVLLGRIAVHAAWDAEPAALEAQHYLAPEAERASVAADLYALGVLAVQLLTGRPPVTRRDARALRAALGEPRAPGWLAAEMPSLPPPIASWLERLLSPAVEARPESARAALAELGAGVAEARLTLQEPPLSSAGAEPALEPIEIDEAPARWKRYEDVFTEMLRTGFPAGAPGPTRSLFDVLAARVEALHDLGARAREEVAALDALVARVRGARAAIAEQMRGAHDRREALREEAAPLRIAARRHAERAVELQARLRDRRADARAWEERGDGEPHRELAEIYREMGDLIDKWWGVREAERACAEQSAMEGGEVADVAAQLVELRDALRVHESNAAAELAAASESLAELGRRADALELELVDLASRLSAPLRSRPELGDCFRRLART
jgi:serine/threonine-protein kinase